MTNRAGRRRRHRRHKARMRRATTPVRSFDAEFEREKWRAVREWSQACDRDLIVAMRNALPALLRVARVAQQLRKAMTTPPKGYGDEHQGYWWTAATEQAAEEVAKAVDELEKP